MTDKASQASLTEDQRIVKAAKKKRVIEAHIGLRTAALQTELIQLLKIAESITDFHEKYNKPETYKARPKVDTAANLLMDVINVLRDARYEIEES